VNAKRYKDGRNIDENGHRTRLYNHPKIVNTGNVIQCAVGRENRIMSI